MEHISEILKNRTTQTGTSSKNTDTWSSAEAEEKSPSGPVCPICNGAGFVYTNAPVGHHDFGKALPCRCRKKQLDKEGQDRLEKFSNLGALTRLTFDNLLPEGRSGDPSNQARFKRAYEAAKAFAAAPTGWLVLVGANGCGKTHLAAAIANARIKGGQAVLFQAVPDLLDHLRSAFNPSSQVPYDEMFDRVRNAPLLILDDLGAQTSTPWAREKLDQLLNHRFNNELPTVITTSTPMDELDDRLRVRLADAKLSQVYAIEGKPSPFQEYGWGPGFELQKTMTFETFDYKRVNLPPDQRENLEGVYREALNFARSPEGWLILQGVTGCGKTHLASAIANYRYQARQPALFIVVPDFLDHLRSTFSPESKVSYDQLFEGVKTTPLLILDDFGEQSTSPWAQEKLYQVINHRYNSRLPTVVTTRLSLDEIDSPIGSRFVDHKISLLWNILAPDYRTSRPPVRGGRRPGVRKNTGQ